MKFCRKRFLFVNLLVSVCLNTNAFAEDLGSRSASVTGKPLQLATLLQGNQINFGHDPVERQPLQDQDVVTRADSRIATQHAMFTAVPATTEPSRETTTVEFRLATLLGENALQLRKDILQETRVAVPDCLLAVAPPAELATYSKYDQDDSSRSTIDPAAHKKRQAQVQPIRNSVRLLTSVAYAKAEDAAVAEAQAECVMKSLDSWAAAKSLTSMATPDAVLSRDRWMAEVVLALNTVSKSVPVSPDRRAAYGVWLRQIADSTIEAYSMRLGPNSRTNNHRYWAGLSVIAIGVFLEDDLLADWGRRSFEIGSCQVDVNGLLPGELRRGSKALEYHLYALRPLAAIAKLHETRGSGRELKCFDGFQRLQQAMQDARKDPAVFERFSGARQTVKVSETSFSAALQFTHLGI